MSPSPTSIALVPYYGTGAHYHYESIRNAKLPAIGRVESCACIDAARALLIEIALTQTTAEVFVFIDSDVEFQRTDYDRIVLSAREADGIVGGVYLTRGSLRGDQRLVGKPIMELGDTMTFFEEGKLYPATELGLGFTAVTRTAIEQIVAHHQMEKADLGYGHAYPLFLPMIDEGKYLFEDRAFCKRARDAGVPVLLDTRPVVVHHGQHGFRVTDLALRSQQCPFNIEITSLLPGMTPW
jgi:hypothetical protein